MAEIIPYKPEQGNACEGKSSKEPLSSFVLPEVYFLSEYNYWNVRPNHSDLSLELIKVENDMQLLVNNKPEKLMSGSKLSELLLQLNLLDKRGIAVAVNNVVIAKPGWTGYDLNENDKVTIIRPTQGG